MSPTQLELVEELFPLHRTLTSDGTDEALVRLGQHLPGIDYEIERYPPGSSAWTWRVPARWIVHEAYLETEDGERIVDFADSPLHVVSYSDPVDAWLTREELEPHLHVSAQRPWAVPWEFRFFYSDGWGFCLSAHARDALPVDGRYHAVIRSEQRTGPGDGLAVGVARVGDPDADELLLCAHVCHPQQANDDLSGVATAIEVLRRLAAHPLPDGSLAVRLLVCPEQVGSVCWFSHHEDLIPRLRAGVFCEMTGNDNSLALQRSRQDDHQIDRVARAALARRGEVREGAFRDVVGNDEIVINGPGVDVPCIAITRWPYPEYHTSDDTPAILDEGRLQEAADVVEEVVRTVGTDFVPRRTFKGPVFLSGHGLWVDWREDPDLNHALEKIMLRLEGDRSVWDIAQELGLPYPDVLAYVERFRERGLVDRLPLPRESSGAHPSAGVSPAPAAVLVDRPSS